MGLGPNQIRWLSALESGEFAQGRSQLSLDGKFCCLGVACELFKGDETRIRDRTADGLEYDGETLTAPPYVMDALGLYGEEGETDKHAPMENLTHKNDSGMSFSQIAEMIRDNPHLYFKDER